MTIPVAFLSVRLYFTLCVNNTDDLHSGSFIFPGMPERTKSRFLSGSEKSGAVFRLKNTALSNQQASTGPIQKAPSIWEPLLTSSSYW
jgi:hypothetical protein